jgi:very-short-patch-repair endonuclease
MRNLQRDMVRFGDLARRSSLLALGHTARRLTAAVMTGELFVPRRGWVAASNASPNAVRAVALGGRLGGASALSARGIWLDDDAGLVVSCSETASRLPRLRPGETRIWPIRRFERTSDTPWMESVCDALVQYAAVATPDGMIATLDSALHLRLLTNRELLILLDALPQRVRPRHTDLDGRSMSGTESHTRVELRRAGYRVEVQVKIAGVGVVDLLVDKWHIVECDSRQFHDGEKDQENDRRRDGAAALLGYATARFTYSQVMRNMPWCLSVVAAGLARGRPEQNPGSDNRRMPVG